MVAPQTVPSQVVVLAPGRGPLLVLVADGPGRSLIGAALERAGVPPGSCVFVADLAAARAALTEQTVDGLVIDLQSVAPHEIEAVAVLQTAANGLPTVLVSGEAEESVLMAALLRRSGAQLRRSELAGSTLAEVLAELSTITRSGRVSGGALDSIATPAVALDGSGRIIATNPAWEAALLERGGVPDTAGVGINYLTVCDVAVGPDEVSGREAAAVIRAVLRGDTDNASLDYPCAGPGDERWYSMRVATLGRHGGGAIVSHLDITTVKLAERRLQAADPAVHPALAAAAPVFALLEPDLTVRHVSPEACATLGLQAQDVVGRDALERVDPADRERTAAAFEEVAAVPGHKVEVHLRSIDDDGRWHDLDLTLLNLLDDPTVRAVAVTGSDVTAARQVQIAHSLETDLLHRLPAAVIVTDDRGVVTYWNHRAEVIFGYSQTDAMGRPIVDLNVGPVGAAQAATIMQTVLEDGRWEGEYDAHRADGSIVPIYSMLEAIEDEGIGFRGIMGASIEISERRRLEADLAFLAHHDPLTGLPNRRLFVEHLERAVAAAVSGASAAVVFIDIDDFKEINDSAGHAVGDEVLRGVAAVLRSALREGDIVARFGGDEFVICCGGVAGPHEAVEVAERVLTAMADAPIVGRWTASASIGVAVSTPGMHGEALLRNADIAMYLAKENGKGQVQLFDDDLHERARRRHGTVQELTAGLAAGQLETYYQPQVDLRSGLLCGFEALVRWRHPRLGLIEPAAFLAEAEESGLIVAVDRQVLIDGCRELARWRAESGADLSVSVNVSARQLTDPDFPSLVASAIDAAAIPADRLSLEVTEHVLMDGEVSILTLRSLKAIGVRIAIDDFGVGYSSLSRLRSFPVDCLKVDRSFVEHLGEDADDEAIVAAIVGLARSLRLAVVVEGIENDRQLELAVQLGCETGQGYFWSPAVPSDRARSIATGPRLGGTVLPRQHRAVLHGSDAELMTAVADDLAAGLAAGEGALVVATSARRAQLTDALADRGVDLAAVGDRFAAVDAGALLRTFLKEGSPDPHRFRAVVRAALAKVGAGQRPVRAFGEMVGLLWDDQNILASLELEGLWEELQSEVPFSLLCGYRIDPDDRDAVNVLVDACRLNHRRVDLV